MSSDLTIRTDNKPRKVLGWFDLTAKEQKKFDYLDNESKQCEAEFVRYEGVVYDLNAMERGYQAAMPAQFLGWDNYLSDSFFSGILVRWVQDDPQGQMVICGTYFS